MPRSGKKKRGHFAASPQGKKKNLNGLRIEESEKLPEKKEKTAREAGKKRGQKKLAAKPQRKKKNQINGFL